MKASLISFQKPSNINTPITLIKHSLTIFFLHTQASCNVRVYMTNFNELEKL